MSSSSDKTTIRADHECLVTGTTKRTLRPLKLIHVFDNSTVYKQLNRSRNKMDEMRQQQYGTDIILKCIDGVLHVHKIVLISSCNYFEAMLTADMLEKNSGQVNFTVFAKNVIEIIVQYLYTAQLPNLNKDYDLLSDLISTCHLMRISDLLHHCWDRLAVDVSVHTFPKMWTLAAKFDLCRRDCKLLRFVRENIEEISANESIQLLRETEMIYFVECVNDVSRCNCSAIAKCIFKWKCNGDRNRERGAVRLLRKIKLKHLDVKTVYRLLELNRSSKCKTVQDVMIAEAVARFPERLNALMTFAHWDAERDLNVERNGNAHNSGGDLDSWDGEWL